MIQVHAETMQYHVARTSLVMQLEFYHFTFLNGDLQVSSTRSIPVNHFHPTVQVTRKLLREALKKRFFNRYSHNRLINSSRGAGKPNNSYLLEMATVLHPAYKKLSCLNEAIVSIADVDTERLRNTIVKVKQDVHTKILDLANRVYGLNSNENCNTRNILNMSSDDCFEIDHMADAFSVASVSYCGISDTVYANFQRYLSEKLQRSRSEQKNILGWWQINQVSYHYLSKVAQSVLVSLASSSALEIDNGLGRMFLSKDRLSTSTQIVEMKLFVKRNETFLNWNNIRQINSKNLEQHLPRAPTIPFVEQDLKYAEKEIYNFSV